MSDREEIMDVIRGFGINSCHVMRRDMICLTLQSWEVDDSLEPRPTILLFYYPDRLYEDQLAIRQIDDVVGLHGCSCVKPSEQWVFVTDPGEVYVVGQGDDGYEDPIGRGKRHYFTSVKSIAPGYAYASGLGRTLYKRIAGSQWSAITRPFTGGGEKIVTSFLDFDGFSDQAIYACGGAGDLFAFDGAVWRRQDVPTNARLEKLCCAADGKVYVVSNANSVVVGDGGSWRMFEQHMPNEMIESIIRLEDGLIASSNRGVYELKEGRLRPASFSLPSMDSYAHLAAGDGILVIGGAHEAYYRATGSWRQII